MFRSTITVTRPDRDRLLEVTRTGASALGWALFVDELRREIDGARVVDQTRVPHDVVTMHSTVRTRDLATGVVEVHTLVYPEEADLRSGKLSVLAPFGTALLGTRAGDIVRVATGDGVRALKVDAVLYQPESAGRRGELLASGEKASGGKPEISRTGGPQLGCRSGCAAAGGNAARRTKGDQRKGGNTI